MRILQLHCERIEYRPISKEIPSARDTPKDAVTLDNVIVAFTAIEDGDDADVVQRAAADISLSVKKIGCPHVLVYPYAHLSSKLARPDTARALLEQLESSIDVEKVSSSPFGWTKSYSISVKGHPLAESLRVFEPATASEGQDEDCCSTSEALKSESRLKSTWYVLQPDGQLIDAEKFDFVKTPKLKRLFRHESAGTRRADEIPPHVALMKKIGIADYEPASDSGNMRFFPNGRLIKSLIERYVTERVCAYGASEVETPIMYDTAHPSMKSYFDRFPARQYTIDSEGRQFFLRFAACFGQFLIAEQAQLSHRNLPYRLYELTRYSFRREQSGELVGLRRLRAFTMPDCHAFCADMTQAVAELERRFELSRSVIKDIGLSDSDYEMSVRLTREFYDKNTDMVHGLVKKHDRPILVEMWAERFFYFVFKWEFNYVDDTGKASALSTDQIDVENGQRYGIKFVDSEGEHKHPIILHNSPSGAIERVIYALLENAAQSSRSGIKPSLPLWLSPTQVRIIPLTDKFLGRAQEVADELASSNVRADIDDRNESIGKRIRYAEKEWIHYVAVIGEAEVASGNISVRDRATGKTAETSIDGLVQTVDKSTLKMPYIALNAPRLLSARPQIMI